MAVKTVIKHRIVIKIIELCIIMFLQTVLFAG
jgi:hypothetical protein